MRRTILLTLLIGGGALGVAACGSSGSDSGTASTGSSAGIVTAKTVDGVGVLTDSAGKTLYSASVETGGRVHCVGRCTSFWDPVLGSRADAMQAAAKLHAKVGVAKRPDGRQQLTFDGRPVYTFTSEGAGKLQGDGFSDEFQGTHFQWSAARTSGDTQSAGKSTQSSGGGYGY
jgi:predicted lipoprotein with Yx(FWY)xxD motif